LSELAVPAHLQLRKLPKQKRTRILLDKVAASTVSLVQEHGYQAVNTNAIALHAGIDVKSLYEFYPNKEAILYRIADNWLSSLREICLKFETESYVDLNWREYFFQLQQACRADGNYEKNYNSLQGLWDLMPEFILLDEYHRDFLIDFQIRQLRRFGAKNSEQELKTLCLFILGMEDGLGLILSHVSKEQAEKLCRMQYDTLCFHFEKILG